MQNPIGTPGLEGKRGRHDAAAVSVRAEVVGAPVLLGGALVLAMTPLAFLEVLSSAMWLHELGHASVAWLTGCFALPIPWMTLGSSERSWSFVVLEVALLGLWATLSRSHRRVPLALGALLLVGLLVPAQRREVLRLFFGDGGAMVFGAALVVAGLLLPVGSRFARGGLRWGFLLLGAFGFSAPFFTWVHASRHREDIPFGAMEGVGLSDASRLSETHGWTDAQLVHRHVGLGVVCLVVMALAWLVVFLRRGPERGELVGQPARIETRRTPSRKT